MLSDCGLAAVHCRVVVGSVASAWWVNKLWSGVRVPIAIAFETIEMQLVAKIVYSVLTHYMFQDRLCVLPAMHPCMKPGRFCVCVHRGSDQLWAAQVDREHIKCARRARVAAKMPNARSVQLRLADKNYQNAARKKMLTHSCMRKY